MKKCFSCNKTYNDEMGFCAVCGSQLVSVQSQPEVQPGPAPTPTPAPGPAPTPMPGPAPAPTPAPTPASTGSSGSSSGLGIAMPFLLSIGGVIVAWYISATFGLILSIVGLITGIAMKGNSGARVFAVIVSIISLIIIIYWLIEYGAYL